MESNLCLKVFHSFLIGYGSGMIDLELIFSRISLDFFLNFVFFYFVKQIFQISYRYLGIRISRRQYINDLLLVCLVLDIKRLKIFLDFSKS